MGAKTEKITTKAAGPIDNKRSCKRMLKRNQEAFGNGKGSVTVDHMQECRESCICAADLVGPYFNGEKHGDEGFHKIVDGSQLWGR